MNWPDLAGGALAALGTVLVAIAGLGLVRLPDTYSRINAVTKAATLGVVCVLLGVMVIAPSLTSLTLLALAILLQLLTTPFGSYAVGRAAHRSGSPLADITHHDELHRRPASPPRRARTDTGRPTRISPRPPPRSRR